MSTIGFGTWWRMLASHLKGRGSPYGRLELPARIQTESTAFDLMFEFTTYPALCRVPDYAERSAQRGKQPTAPIPLTWHNQEVSDTTTPETALRLTLYELR